MLFRSVSYEFIRLAGNTDNLIIRILSLPGMWLQSLTTKEPDDDMIEVAIAAVEAVFDWRVYQGRAEEEPIEALAESLEEEAAPATEQPETEAEEQPEAAPDRTAEETAEEIELEEIMSVEAAGLEGPEYEEEQEEASEGFQDIEDILEAEQ